MRGGDCLGQDRIGQDRVVADAFVSGLVVSLEEKCCFWERRSSRNSSVCFSIFFFDVAIISKYPIDSIIGVFFFVSFFVSIEDVYVYRVDDVALIDAFRRWRRNERGRIPVHFA